MKSDYSRDTFDPQNHYTRVLLQQGRVVMDADWNEQASILLHYLQTLARDLIGPYGMPWDSQGFMIMPVTDGTHTKVADFEIGVGRYYVDGILCEMDQPPTYFRQPDYPLDPVNRNDDKLPDAPFLVYLDVWERHITAIEDPHIREVALGGPDTAARTKIVWQVKVKSWQELNLPYDPAKVKCELGGLVEHVMSTLIEHLPNPFSWGVRLAARAQVPEDIDSIDPCLVSPEARYRGAENQLYRVEIHRGGRVGDINNGATFKWSREDGSVVFPILSISGETVSVEHLGRDARFGLEVGDWVEVVDDDYVLRGRPEPLLRVETIGIDDLQVILSGEPRYGHDRSKRPLLRRWDHRKGDPTKGGLQIATDGAALVVQSDTAWLNLEDGIQILFPTGNTNYFTGNYWLVPARTATGDVEWPSIGGTPVDLEPRGIQHHYAPLAIVLPRQGGTATSLPGFPVTDLRHSILPAASCCPVITIANPPTAARGPISFTAQLSNTVNVVPGLTFAWTVTGGTITKRASASITVTPTAGAAEVIAELTIEGLPPNCPNRANGKCLIIPS